MCRGLAFLTLASLTSACTIAADVLAQAPRSPTPQPTEAPIRVTTVTKGLEHPWGLAFLPDGRMLVTERPGRLRIVDKDGRLSKPLGGVPEVLASSQGGLLDVALSPNFARDQLVYLSFSEPGEDGASTAVVRGRLGSRALEGVQVIWRQVPKVRGSNHWGSRLVFRRDGTLFITTGDRYEYRQRAQDLSTTIGKIVRITPDGSIPQDNPFVRQEGVRSEIWSYGHRNVQAATLHPETGELWTAEHGARGGDELNNPQPGRNYGWPVITYGVDYSGSKIGQGTANKGMEQPVYYWDPVIAPSGALFYTGDAFPEWRGDLFIGSMQPGLLVRLDLEGGRVTREERYLGDLDGRIRDVQQGPDGFIYLLTDSSEGGVLRIEPARSPRR
ncbi:MAG TPA: PQQ-dependent sugar dehydrogenase [Gemmatimonadales bacterium]|nr:PQQ-dependent sugar dehydrogenase [Gemmatimonadales bacterium]